MAQEKGVDKKKKPKVEKVERPAAPGEAAQAFDRVRPAIEAVKDEDLVPINVDIPRAVATVLGTLAAIEALKERLDPLPLDRKRLGNLRDLTFAAWYAHLAATPPSSETQKAALLAEGGPLRESMLIQAEALAHAGLFDKPTVANIRSGTGPLDSANDLVSLAALFTQGWSRVENKTTVTWEDVERAAHVGPLLLLAVSDRPIANKDTDAQKTRARAFTLFVNAYDEARRGVTFVRWHDGDADEIAPSIYGGRKRRSKGSEEEPTGEGGQGGGGGPTD